ncbi:hypothetical protein K1X76_02940 [bacterium]|nr:hypothetical protein [bacterium]
MRFYKFAVLILFISLISACAQRNRANYCNMSDVITCGLSFTDLDLVRDCVAQQTGSACELSQEAIDEINGDNSDGQVSYTCNSVGEWIDEVEARGLSVTHFTNTSKKTIYVDLLRNLFTEYDDYAVTRTIQGAIDLADSNTQIVICPGNYYETLNLSGSGKDNLVISNIADGNKALADLTVLHPLAAGSVLQINDTQNVVLKGLTFQNGVAEKGAGVKISLYRNNALTNADVLITNSVFQNNTAVSWGGAIFVEGYGDVKIENSTLQNNTAGYGGAIASLGFDGQSKIITLSNVTITQNKAVLGGPALYTSGNDSVVMDAVTVTLNSDAASTQTLPAIYLGGNTQLDTHNTGWGSAADKNLGDDILNENQFFDFLEAQGIDPQLFDWTDWAGAWNEILGLHVLSDADEILEEQPWVYNYEGILNVNCNLATSTNRCDPASIENGSVHGGDDDDDDDDDDDSGGSFGSWIELLLSELRDFTSNSENLVHAQGTVFKDGEYTFYMQGLRAKINSLNFLTDTVLPSLANADNFDTGLRLKNITLLSEEDDKTPFCLHDWKLKASTVELWPDMAHANVESRFLAGNKLELNFDSDNAEVEADMDFESFPKIWGCLKKHETFSLEGKTLSASLTVELGIDSTGAYPIVKAVTDSSFDLEKVTFDGGKALPHLNARTMMMGDVGADDPVFATAGSDVFNSEMLDKINAMIKDLINLEGDLSSPLPLHYKPQLTNLTTDNNGKAFMDFTLAVNVQKGLNICGILGLPMNKVDTNPADIPSWGDVTFELPYWTLSTAISLTGMSGLLCQNFNINLGITDLDLSLKPWGQFDIHKAPSGSNALIEIDMPLKGYLNEDDFTLNLILQANVNTSCDSGVNVEIQNAEIENLSGTVNLNGFSLDITQFDFLIEAAVKAYFQQNSTFPVSSKLIGLDNIGPWAAKVSDIGTGANSVYIGIDFVDDDYCDIHESSMIGLTSNFTNLFTFFH